MFAPLIAAAALLALGASPSPDWSIPEMRGRLVSESSAIRLLGVNPADYIFRLDYLSQRIDGLVPASAANERADLQQEAALELKLDAELLVNLCPVFAGVAGLDESFYNEDPRTPPDPVAFYVPAPDRNGRFALVVLLHGRAETETDVLSHAVFRQLADRYHAILVAPWGTGSVLWGEPASAEVLRIQREVVSSFPIDPRRIYLGGIGLGGVAVFHLAGAHPDAWNGLLSIDGGLRPEDYFLASHRLRDRSIYLVGGGKRSVMGPDVQSGTYRALAHACLPVSLYDVNASTDVYAGGGDIARAWGDMFDGVVRNTNSRECGPMI